MLKILIDDAISILREYEPPEGYYLANSGGKDSTVCHHLLVLSGCKFSSHYSSTTIDPPDLGSFIKKVYPDTIWHYPKWHGKPTNYYQMIIKKGLPSRMIRWCCQILKETGGAGRLLIDGVRSSESYSRSKRNKFEYFFNQYYKTKNKKNILDQELIDKLYLSKKCKKIIHIIFEWTDKNVWDFIKLYNLPYCCLYDQGYLRIGCVGCPMSSYKNTLRDFERYPVMKRNIIKSIEIRRNIRHDYPRFDSAEDIFNWWISKQTVIKYLAAKQQYTLKI